MNKRKSVPKKSPKKTVKRKSRTSCAKTQIRNPETKRCVKKCSPTGKKITRSKKSFRKPSPSRPCSEGKVLNNKSKRCVDKCSKKGQEISKCQSSKIGTIMSEFKNNALKTGRGNLVTNRKQAIAIALSIANKSC